VFFVKKLCALCGKNRFVGLRCSYFLVFLKKYNGGKQFSLPLPRLILKNV